MLVDDPEAKVIYAAIPLDNAVECTHILAGDYNTAFNRYGQLVGALVRWSLWAFPWFISTVVLDSNQLAETVLKQSGFEGNIYEADEDLVLDDNTRITSYIESWLMTSKGHNVNHFGFIEGRMEGIGSLSIYLYNTNKTKQANPPKFTLSPLPNLFYQKPINFTDTKMSVKLISNLNAGDKFKIFDLSVDMKPIWMETPRV